MLTYTSAQQAILNEKGSSVTLGAPGTGKTTVLMAKVKQLLDQGTPPEDIYVATFTFRALAWLRHNLKFTLGEEAAAAIITGTLRDFALTQLEAAQEESLKIASNTVVRRVLRQAMHEVEFPGLVYEAEHIIRSFKARARKPQENEAHYNLLQAYKAKMESRGYLDRFDVVRNHIRAMREGEAAPAPAKHILVDNVQDATRIQLLWLFDHMKQGAVLSAFGCDDVTTYARDGALGAAAIVDLQNTQGVKAYVLEEGFRVPSNIASAIESIVSPIDDRLTRTMSTNARKGAMTVHPFETARQEVDALMKAVRSTLKNNPQARVAILTRRHRQAYRLHRKLTQMGVKHACLAHSLWETPGAIAVGDLLALLLGEADEKQLRNVLLGFGLKTAFVDNLLAHGLATKGWLEKGAPLPEGVSLPNATLTDFSGVQRRLLGYFKAMSERKAPPADVFKAAVSDMLDVMGGEDEEAALLALETLLNMRGNLRQKLKELRLDIQPDVTARVIVGPVAEVRNMAFDYVFLPFVNQGNYPFSGHKVLGENAVHDRHLLYLGMSRTSQYVSVSFHGEKSPFIEELLKTYRE